MEPYQFGGAASGEHPAGALEVQMSRAPAAHVEPLHRPGGAWPVLLVQQHQLLQGPHCRVLQHLLQLGDRMKRDIEWHCRVVFQTSLFGKERIPSDVVSQIRLHGLI